MSNPTTIATDSPGSSADDSVSVSIVIPIYNAELYLRDCLDSVLAQTLSGIRILCVDDGSTDRSGEILDEYAAADSRIRIFKKINGGGCGAARNAALPHLEGKYLLFVDSDDVVEPTLCEKAFRCAEDADAEIVVYFWDRFPDQTMTDPMDTTSTLPIVAATPDDALAGKIDAKLFSTYLMTCCKMYRVDFFKRLELRFPENAFAEDLGMNWKPMIHAKKIAFLPEQLYHYRIRHGSVVRSGKKNPLDGVTAYEHARKDVVESGVYPLIRDHFLGEWLAVVRSYFRTISPADWTKARRRVLDVLGSDEWDFIRSSPTIRPKVRTFFLELERSDKPGFRTRIWLLRSDLRRCFLRFLQPPLNRGHRFLQRLVAGDLLRTHHSLRKNVADLTRAYLALEARNRLNGVGNTEKKAP